MKVKHSAEDRRMMEDPGRDFVAVTRWFCHPKSRAEISSISRKAKKPYHNMLKVLENRQ